jgi:hypothetical protein
MNSAYEVYSSSDHKPVIMLHYLTRLENAQVTALLTLHFNNMIESIVSKSAQTSNLI